jgi:hypothetical protein
VNVEAAEMAFEDMIATAFRVAAIQRALALEEEHARMVEQERLQIMTAAREKASMPANYWHERYRVGEMAKAARRLAEMM